MSLRLCPKEKGDKGGHSIVEFLGFLDMGFNWNNTLLLFCLLGGNQAWPHHVFCHGPEGKPVIDWKQNALKIWAAIIEKEGSCIAPNGK